MTLNQHVLYALGCTHDTMVGTASCEVVRRSQSLKTDLSPDWGLQPDPMKSESLVIANQHVAVNTFLGLVLTAHHFKRAGNTRSAALSEVLRWAQ